MKVAYKNLIYLSVKFLRLFSFDNDFPTFLLCKIQNSKVYHRSRRDVKVAMDARRDVKVAMDARRDVKVAMDARSGGKVGSGAWRNEQSAGGMGWPTGKDG
jgi:hypothetical protein